VIVGYSDFLFFYATSEHMFMALVTINGRLATMSVMLRLNQPSSPSPVVTPVASRPASEEKPDLYCVMANMSSVKCAVGCANLNDSLLVCGQCFIYCQYYGSGHQCCQVSWPLLVLELKGRNSLKTGKIGLAGVGASACCFVWV
jgi:hypothetical protein